MKIHTAFITFNRLELTKQAIQSYLDTVTVPFSLIVVDNASEDGTGRWLQESHTRNALLPENKYPGYACNLGWAKAGSDVTHLHRADNDFKFLPGWCDHIQAMFALNPTFGQLGLRTGEEELWHPQNVGGNCIIRRELWDQGLRWDERPWPEIKTPGITEDSYFSPEVKRMGWDWGRAEQPCIQPISFEDPDDPYYIKTWADRGIEH